ncbi:probable telomerase reverse transcriptase [Coccomyxa sp. Obi]|nr:probable telomerase reverse transcriptase [Coccomyxa sp. Obi]
MATRTDDTKDGQPVSHTASILYRLYPKISPLKDALLQFSGEWQQQLRALLFQSGDPSSYVDDLLSQSLCACNDNALELKGRFTLQQHSSQLEILNRAIDALVRAPGGDRNVLCLGFRKKRPSSRAAPSVGLFGTEAHHPNTTTDLLKGEPWQLLLSRIGDTLMLYLLMHTSLFLPLPNGCFLQVTGSPIAEVAKAKKAAVDPLPPAPLAQPDRCPVAETPASPLTQGGGTICSDSINAGLEDSWPPLGRAAKMRRVEGVNLAQNCGALRLHLAANGTEGISKRRAQRSARPSSWARRRAAAARQAAAMNNSGIVTNYASGLTRSGGGSVVGGRPGQHIGRSGNTCLVNSMNSHRAAEHLSCSSRNGIGQRGNAEEAQLNREDLCSGVLQESGSQANLPQEEGSELIALKRSGSTTGCVHASGMLGTQMLVDTPMELWSFTSHPHDVGDQNIFPSQGTCAPLLLVPKHQPHIISLRTAHIDMLNLVRTHEFSLHAGLAEAEDSARPEQQDRVVGTVPHPPEPRVHLNRKAKSSQQAPQKPSDMLISRTGLFYCATFPSKPGLPSSHLLNALRGKKGAARSLYAAIFLGHTAKLQDRQRSNFEARGPRPRQQRRQLSEAPRRIPARLKPLLAAMQTLLDRSHKCPYSLLLDTHCPLPAAWKRSEPRRMQPRPQPRTQAADVEPCSASERNMSWHERGGSAVHTSGQAAGRCNGHGACNEERDIPECRGRDRTAEASPSRLSSEELIREFVPCHKVTAFAWSVIRHMVPPVLLGDPGNRRALRRAVSRLVCLRRYEQMSVQNALHCVRPTAMPAICCHPPGGGEGWQPPSGHAAVQRRLALWVRWLLAELVVPLLRAHFYCTESEAYRQQVFYYRKPVWLELQREGLASVRDSLFAPLSIPEARSILQGRQLGVASLRLLPKRIGMRPIVNLGRSSYMSFPAPRAPGTAWRRQRARRIHMSFRPVNFHLQSLHKVLKFETERQPGSLGSSVLGYNDAFAKLHPVLRQWRAKRAASPGAAPMPYLVSADVSRAFDNVDADKLINIVEPMLRSQEYLIVKHMEVMPANGGCLRTAYRCTAVDANAAWPGFPAHASRLADKVSQRVFSDKVLYSRVDRALLLQQLREHLQRNIVRFGKTWHYQCHGIPQGSTVSTLLCSLFLGRLEQEHLHPLLPGADKHTEHPGAPTSTPRTTQCSSARFTDLALAAGCTPSTQASVAQPQTSGGRARAAKQRAPAASVLLRLVDDFLLVTPSRSAAEAVALRMLQGFPEYGVSVNPAKTRVSFELRASGAALPRNTVRGADGQEFMPWCGLLVNTASLDLQADYTRYAGAHLASSLTIPLTKEPGKALLGKLCAHVRPKCHPLLLDTSINSPATVRLNLFQIMLLAAMKLHCQVACISGGCGSSAVLTAIRAGIKYLCTLVQRRTAAARSRSKVRCRNSISACHIRWLSLVAFYRVLSRKQARYRAVLRALEAELRQLPFCHLKEQLASVIDPVKSAVFNDIIY